MTYSIDSRGMISLAGNAPVLLSPSEERQFNEKVVQRWTNLAAAASQKYSVPLPWILAIIYAESLGNPNAINAEVPPGIGLMQITDLGLKRGLSNAQVADPATNIDIGVSFMSRIMKLGNRDLPKVASYYNCGGRSDGSPHTAPTSGQNAAWGLCATAGYLERVTSANNSFNALRGASQQGVSGWKRVAGATLGAGAIFLGLRSLFR